MARLISLFLVTLLVGAAFLFQNNLFVPSGSLTAVAAQLGATPSNSSRADQRQVNETITHASIDDCSQEQDAASRADCLFQAIASALQNQRQRTEWTPVPASGLEHLDCSVPAAKHLPPNYLDSFFVLSQLPDKKTELESRLRIERKSVTNAQDSNNHVAKTATVISTAGIFFNQKAKSYICGLGAVTDRSITAGLTTRASSTSRQQIAIPTDPTIFVKPLWYLVPKDPGNETVPVWDADHSLDQFPTGAPLSSWNTLVSIDDVNPEPCKFTYDAWKVNRQPIALGCFFSIDLNQRQCNQVAQQAGTITRQPSAADVGALGCHLVLMAINLSAKIGGAWTWQTYWWSSRAEDATSQDSKRRVTPPSQDGRWRFYSMDTGDSHRLFNPYLEGSLFGGATTDCAQCHGKAEFHSVSPPSEPLLLCLFTNLSNITASPGGCSPGKENIQRLLTDSVWSLADVNVRLSTREDSPH